MDMLLHSQTSTYIPLLFHR